MRFVYLATFVVLAQLAAVVSAAQEQKPAAAQPATQDQKPAEQPVPAEALPSEKEPVPEPSADEAAIRASVEKYVESYNRRDSKSMAAMWSPEAVYTNPQTGEGIVGQEAIAKQFDYEFAGAEDAKLVVVVDSIEFVSPNVAIEKGSATVSYSEFPPEETTYTVVHVKREGKWLIDRVSETKVPAPPHSNYGQLKELEWMIGSWIDEDQTASIRTDCQWTKNKNFMTRSFAAVVGDQVEMSGMQVVGWDPAAKQIRSWVFDSEGGFGEGTWTKKDDKWFITSKGTLPDGRKSSAIHVITMIDDDSYTWQSTDRQVDGEILPNVEEVMIVRAATE
ncbi:MAG: SgcJ/EcaC family oxidoreductase [Pirellulales bacterium]